VTAREQRPWAPEPPWRAHDPEYVEHWVARQVEENRPDLNAVFSDGYGPPVPDGYRSSAAFQRARASVTAHLQGVTDPAGVTAADNRVTGARCGSCGEGFTPARPDARYCSAACKQRAYRRRRNGDDRP
jgi:hypothetical protein